MARATSFLAPRVTKSSADELVVYPDSSDIPHLAWSRVVSFTDKFGLQINRIYVDAQTGLLLAQHPLIWNSRAPRDIYDAQGACFLGLLTPGVLPGSAIAPENLGGDPTALSVYDKLGEAYDYYRSVFGRDSYDGLGSSLIATIHLTMGFGCSGNNAAWYNPQPEEGIQPQMLYGDGDGETFANLALSFDVTAHEVTHGVTSTTANLVYAGQSGALNEASSDILAASAEAHFGSADWKIGEEVYTPAVEGDALRYLYDPALDEANERMFVSADYYPDRLFPIKTCTGLPFVTGETNCCWPDSSNDMCGVHFNSGIPNLFYYLLANGGTHPRGKTTVMVPSIGVQKAEQIWYRTLVSYMTPTTTMPEARLYTTIVASTLYGTGSPEAAAVRAAWNAVGVPVSYLPLKTPDLRAE